MYIRMFIITMFSLMALQGCETVKGAGEGLQDDMITVGKVGQKTAEGTGNFIMGTSEMIKESDQWMRDNMW